MFKTFYIRFIAIIVFFELYKYIENIQFKTINRNSIKISNFKQRFLFLLRSYRLFTLYNYEFKDY